MSVGIPRRTSILVVVSSEVARGRTRRRVLAERDFVPGLPTLERLASGNTEVIIGGRARAPDTSLTMSARQANPIVPRLTGHVKDTALHTRARFRRRRSTSRA